MPTDCVAFIDLVYCSVNTESEANELVAIGMKLMETMGWNDNLFIAGKSVKYEIDMNAALFCKLQLTRSRMKSWMSKPFTAIEEASDFSERKLARTFLSPDMPEETLAAAEWLSWRRLDSQYEKNTNGFAMICTRSAMASSILRFMRSIFLDQCEYEPADKQGFDNLYSRLASFVRAYRNRVMLQPKEMDRIKNAIAGVFLNLGDAHTLTRYHPDYSTIVPCSVVADCMLNPRKLKAWRACCENIKLTPDSAEKDMNRLPPAAQETAYLAYVLQYVHAITNNRIDMKRFCVFWHEWMSQEVLVRLLQLPENGLPKTPTICCMGSDGFWLVYHGGKSFLAPNSIEALAIWITIVKEEQGGKLDDFCRLPELPPVESAMETTERKVGQSHSGPLNKERPSAAGRTDEAVRTTETTQKQPVVREVPQFTMEDMERKYGLTNSR